MNEYELGQLVTEHLEAHQQSARLSAHLMHVAADLSLLADSIARRTHDIDITDASVTVKDAQLQDRAIPLERLDIRRICASIAQYQQASAQETQLAHELHRRGMGYIVDGLTNPRSPAPDRRDRHK